MSTANLHNEQELLQRLASGDEDAFTTIYRFYSSTIFNTAMIFLKDEAESQEIVQEVFVRCWEYREKMRAVRSLRNYFFIATRNRVFDQLTRNIRTKKALLGLREQISSSSEDSIPQLLQQKEYSYLIEQAILELPPQQKQVYRMAEEQALSYDEIAAQLSLSKFTVKEAYGTGPEICSWFYPGACSI